MHKDEHIQNIFGWFEGPRDEAHVWKRKHSSESYVRFFDTGFRQIIHRVEDDLDGPGWYVSFGYDDFIFVRGWRKFDTSKQAMNWVSDEMTMEDEWKLMSQYEGAREHISQQRVTEDASLWD